MPPSPSFLPTFLCPGWLHISSRQDIIAAVWPSGSSGILFPLHQLEKLGTLFLKHVLSEDTTNHLLVTFTVTPNNLKSEVMVQWGSVTLLSLLGPIRQRVSAHWDGGYIFHNSPEEGIVVAPALNRHLCPVLAFGPIVQLEEAPEFFQRS